ncbi:MAG: ANTAR domain-containing protein [Thermoguttaceae bacterium]|nr:ANTAR domain-containing protein [Thermoguttaceae bacterium]MDO4859207.1 ANTAR domain-containing protein [Thermoguttaceae bacterium]
MVSNRVYIAGQKPSFVAKLAAILERNGFVVVGSTDSADEAKRRCRELYPDIFLTLQRLRDGTGSETAEILQDVAQGVVLLDADSAGLVDDSSSVIYLQMPVHEEILVNTMNVLSHVGGRMHSLTGRISELETTIRDQKQINRAKGLVMRIFAMSEEDAYAFLRKVAMNRRVKIAEAALIVLNEYGSGKDTP